MPEKAVFGDIDGARAVGYSALKRGELLDQTKWAGEFSWNQIQTLARFMHPYQADDGTTLIHEGDPGSFMCLIVQGLVDVTKQDSKRRPKHLTSLGPGSTFGEMALIDAEPRSASVIVRGQALILVLSEQDFENLAEDTPSLAIKLIRKIARMMSSRLRQTSGALSECLERSDE